MVNESGPDESSELPYIAVNYCFFIQSIFLAMKILDCVVTGENRLRVRLESAPSSNISNSDEPLEADHDSHIS